LKKQTNAVFSALADPTRRDLLVTLSREDTATASRLASDLPISRQAVAKHLGALRDADLVSSERVGRETLYRLHPEPLGEVATWIKVVGAQWDRRLEALERALQRWGD
jgi:DNA-binding transcriptional ArsR family regulator